MEMKALYTLSLLILIFNLLYAQAIPPKREFRAVWVASVYNIDWPTSKFLNTTQQRTEYTTLLDIQKANGMNAVLVQIRPSCDAFYANSKEPWSEWLMGSQGTAPIPFYDPLQFMIEETHKRGMEFHAWFNPYRSQVASSSSIHQSHISKTKPEWNLRFNSPHKLLDPGIPAVRDYVVSVIMDVVRRYEIDGVHFDDYFYPYEGITNQDSASWRDYPRGFTNIRDWRRDNVNTLIRMVHDSIITVKPNVKFGISPFGIWKSGVPPGITGLSAFDAIYCDALTWLNERKVDYITPQLYWRFGGGQDYAKLMPWWSSQLNGRHLYTGNAAYRLNPSGDNWPATEIAEQVRWNRMYPNTLGQVFFSSKSITNNFKGIQDSLRNNLYKYPAFVPVMPWKDAISPLPPRDLTASGSLINITLQWKKPLPAPDGDGAKYFVIYRAESPDTININDPRYIRKILSTDTTTYIDVFSVSWNRPYTYIITSMDKLHNESEPIAKVTFILTDVTLAASLPKEFRLEQNYPNPFNPSTVISYQLSAVSHVTLKVFDILGKEIETLVDEVLEPGIHHSTFHIPHSAFTSGVYFYQLRAGSYVETKKMILQK
jgi:uncharacterized lipoprotein YddW (UPF0748 family)